MNIKNIILIILIITIIIISITSCYEDKYKWDIYTTETYNEDPDIESKDNTLERINIDIMPINTIDRLMEWTDVIIIGKIQPAMKVVEETMETLEKDTDLEKSPSFITGVSTIKVEKVLYGSLSQEQIEIQQGYNIVSDERLMKRYGDRAVFFLVRSKVSDYYSPTSNDTGLFYIDSENKVMTITRNIHMAKYDDVDLGLLMRDLDSALVKTKGVHILD